MFRKIALCAVLSGSVALAQDAAAPPPPSSEVYVPTYVPVEARFRPHAFWSVSWETAIPVGSVRSFIPWTTPRGIAMEGSGFITPGLSLGFQARWNLLATTAYDKTSEVNAASTITSTQYRTADMWHLAAITRYYFHNSSQVTPYIGLAIGASTISYRIRVVDLAFTYSNWFFNLSPELGVLFSFTSGPVQSGINAAVRFTYTTGAYVPYVYNTSMFGLNLGYFVMF